MILLKAFGYGDVPPSWEIRTLPWSQNSRSEETDLAQLRGLKQVEGLPVDFSHVAVLFTVDADRDGGSGGGSGHETCGAT